jgi:hypothetical protein
MAIRDQANAIWIFFCMSMTAAAVPPNVEITRIGDGPIIHSGLHPSIGENIQGPSVIRVPDWIEDPLGKFYLYFADHKGRYIRLAYANEMTGPWQIHTPGSLQIEDSHFLTSAPKLTAEREAEIRQAAEARGVRLLHDVIQEVITPHIASPDVHVDHVNQRIVMYFHGLEGVGHQVSRVAVSKNGIAFEAQPEQLGRTYMRIFDWQGDTYALAMPGQLYRAEGKLALGSFEPGPLLFNKNMRHNAVLVSGDQLLVFWTQVGDAPEHIKLSTIALRGDWQQWLESEPVEVLRPELSWEGADAPVEPSVRSSAYGLVNQLRDPAIFVDDGETYLLYAIGGEAGIALAEVVIRQP